MFQALGRTVGQCHQIAQLYHPPAGLQRPEWDSLQNCFNPLNYLAAAAPWLLAKHSGVLKEIQGLPNDPSCYGLTHMDLHFGNFFVESASQRITLFDFDDCAYGWYIMDIAMLLFDVLVVYDQADRLQFGRRFLTNLLKGYLPHMPDRIFWVMQLPLFLKLLEISMFMTLYSAEFMDDGDDWVAKFMRGRNERIQQDLPYANLDFEVIYRQSAALIRSI